MIHLEHRQTGEGILVESVDGYDLVADWRVVSENAAAQAGKRWDASSQTWIARTPSALEQVESALGSDPLWSALRDATPAQVAQWMQANVTNLAQARAVLVLLALAVQRLARRAGAN